MQWRIVKNIKQILETLKQELKGPQVNNLIIDKKNIKINNQQINNDLKINLYNSKVKYKIKNLNDNFNLNIKEMTIKGEILKTKLLKDKFSLGNKELIIKKNQKTKIKKLDTILGKILISKIEIDKLKKNQVKEINLKIKLEVKKDCSKINKIPKKVKGEKIYFYPKSELLKISRKLKLSKPDLNMKNYTIKAFFVKIPLENINNLKYHSKDNILEMYYNNNEISSKEVDLIVLKNKLNEIEKKIFI